MKEQVVVKVFDTITKTITIRENENGDTLRLITVIDKTKATTKDRYHDVKEKVLIKTDTVYVEKQSDKQTVVAADPNVEIDKDGNVTRKVNRTAQTLKWVFFAVISITILIIVFRVFLKR